MPYEGVRNGYAKLGVDQYYELHNTDYRNPHEKVVKELINIAQGSGIVGSKVLDLCPQSLLPMGLWRIGEVTNTLVIITPHKRPDCDNISGWILVDEILLDRVRMRIYYR